MTVPAAAAPFGRGVAGNRWDLVDGGEPVDLPTVSVIVPYYRQQAELDRTLAALARQTYPAPLVEVVVVDDGSPVAPVVPEGVVVVRQRDLGFRLAAARNLGVRASHGDVLCFLDADTSPEPHYVERLTRLVALAPETVTVGRRRHADFRGVAVDEPVEAAGPARELDEPQWLVDAYERSRDLLDADDRSYRYLIGAVTACSRWFFDQVGGYDEGFQDYGGEDWEWAHRAWIAGAVFAHVRDAVAWHDGPEWAERDESAEVDDSTEVAATAEVDASSGVAATAEVDASSEVAASAEVAAAGDAGAGALDAAAARRRAKNAETLRLSDVIPVRESRGVAVRSRTDDVIVHLLSAASPARAYLCVDTVLAALPQARVVVPDEVAAVFAADQRVVDKGAWDARVGDRRRPPRVVVTFATALRLHDGSALAAAVESVGVGDLGRVHFTAASAAGGPAAAGAAGGSDAAGATGGPDPAGAMAGSDADVLVRVDSRRADQRRARWRTDEFFVTRREPAPWLTPLTEEPSLAAYLGGWG